jgi:mono/diheme cytochrome c family protein
MQGFHWFRQLLVFFLCFGLWGQGFARPTKEEKAERRASYWGLFADVYRARGCLDLPGSDPDCANRALRDASTHVAGVDAAVDANEQEFSNEIRTIQSLFADSKVSVAADRLAELVNKLIIEFASNTAPVVQPSRELGARVYNEYCASCHGDGAGSQGHLTSKLRFKPLDFSIPERRGSQSPFGIYAVMIHGIDRSEMSSMLDVLSVDELWSVAFYVASFPYKSLEPSDVAGISLKIKPIAKEFALSTLATSTDEALKSQLIRSGVSCGACEKEVAFLRSLWPWNGDSGRLGDIEESPLQKTESRALFLLLLAIIAVSGGFYFVLRRTGRVE